MKAKRLKRKLSLKSTRSDLPLASRRAMGASGPSLPIHLGGAFGGGAAGAASSSLRALSRTHSVWVDSLGKTSSAFNHWARAWIKSPCSSIIFAAAARRCNSWACTSEWHCGHTKVPGASAHVQFLQFSINSGVLVDTNSALFFNPQSVAAQVRECSYRTDQGYRVSRRPSAARQCGCPRKE